MASQRRARTNQSNIGTERASVRRAAAYRLCAAALALWLPAAAAAPVWVAERGEQRLYLLGSIHVLDAGTVAGDALLTSVYSDATRVVLEMDLTALDPGTLERLLAERALLSDGRTLADEVGPAHWPTIRNAANAADVDLAPLRRSEPWYAAMLVTQLLLKRQGYDGDHGVDAIVGQWAVRDGKPVSGLETAAQQIGFFDTLSAAAQRELLVRTLLEARELDDDMRALAQAWRDGDLAFIEAELYPQLRDVPELHRRLLVERNRRWVERIASREDSGPVLVVVGALHLVGPDSLIAGLEARGFRVARLADPDQQVVEKTIHGFFGVVN